MREQVAFQLRVVQAGIDDLKEYFCRVEIKDTEQHLAHVQLTFQKSVVELVALHVCVDRSLVVLLDLLLVDSQQVESDIVRVAFDGICEELNLKRNVIILHEL